MFFKKYSVFALQFVFLLYIMKIIDSQKSTQKGAFVLEEPNGLDATLFKELLA